MTRPLRRRLARLERQETQRSTTNIVEMPDDYWTQGYADADADKELAKAGEEWLARAAAEQGARSRFIVAPAGAAEMTEDEWAARYGAHYVHV